MLYLRVAPASAFPLVHMEQRLLRFGDVQCARGGLLPPGVATSNHICLLPTLVWDDIEGRALSKTYLALSFDPVAQQEGGRRCRRWRRWCRRPSCSRPPC